MGLCRMYIPRYKVESLPWVSALCERYRLWDTLRDYRGRGICGYDRAARLADYLNYRERQREAATHAY